MMSPFSDVTVTGVVISVYSGKEQTNTLYPRRKEYVMMCNNVFIICVSFAVVKVVGIILFFGV